MRRLYGLPALVAALTILANGFIQQTLISTSAINSSLPLTSLKPKKITETSKETSLTKENRNSLWIFPKDVLKKITKTSNQISLMGVEETTFSPEIRHTTTETSLIKFYPITAIKNSDQNIRKPTKNDIKPGFITEFHEPQTWRKTNYSTPPQISNLPNFLDGNYANEYLINSGIKFRDVLQPSRKVQDNFGNLPVSNSSDGKKVLNILSLIAKGSGEVYSNTSNYRNSVRSNSDQSSKADHNRDFPQAVSVSGFNQLKVDQSSFTIKEFPQRSSPSFVTTDSKIPNSGETTVNAALNKQPENGESSSTFAITVNGNSEISSPRMVDKDSSIGVAANVFPEPNKFHKFHEVRDTGSRIGLPTPSKNLVHKEEDSNLKSKISSQSSVVFSLLKNDQKSGNKLCKRVGSTCLNQKVETKGKNGIVNILPSSLPVNLETVNGDIDENSSPQKLEGSMKPELCKLLTMCSSRKESTQLKEKGKSVFSLKYASTEPKKNLSFVVEESKVEDFNNKAVQRESLNFTSSSKLGRMRVQAFGENARGKEKLKGSEKEVDPLNDASGIINKRPYSLNSESQLNYSSGNRKEESLKSLQISDNISHYSLKDQFEFSSIFSYENITPPDQYFQLNQNKGRRFTEIIFSNPSNDHRNETMEEVSDPNFIIGQIRNYALDKDESNLENGTIKESSSEKNLGESNESGKVGSLHFLDRNQSGIEMINEGLIVNERLNSNEDLRVNESLTSNGSLNMNEDLMINETLRMDETGEFNITLTGDEGSGENLTKVSTPVNQWPVKHSAVVEGDLVLGGLMMVHEREDTITCGPVMPQGGVQALEAMLYTLDRLNDQEIVPGVKIGAHILDDCDKDTYGLEMAVDFIKGSEKPKLGIRERPDECSIPPLAPTIGWCQNLLGEKYLFVINVPQN